MLIGGKKGGKYQDGGVDQQMKSLKQSMDDVEKLLNSFIESTPEDRQRVKKMLRTAENMMIEILDFKNIFPVVRLLRDMELGPCVGNFLDEKIWVETLPKLKKHFWFHKLNKCDQNHQNDIEIDAIWSNINPFSIFPSPEIQKKCIRLSDDNLEELGVDGPGLTRFKIKVQKKSLPKSWTWYRNSKEF